MVNETDKQRLMAYLDGELDSAERAQFEKRLEAEPELARELNAFRGVMEPAGALRFKAPDESVWDNYWDEVHSRLGLRIGWILLLIGGLLFVTFGVVVYWAIPDHNPLADWAIVFIVAGLGFMFFGALRGRLKELKHDRYRKVRR